MASPDLFVVCKKCGSEVSPYITECPYCGTRLRKRAPKIERDGTLSEPKPKAARRTRPPKPPRLGRLRSGEIAGIRGDATGRPVATMALVTLSLFGFLVLAVVNRGDIALAGPVDGQWWRVATSPFLYGNLWYELAAVTAIGVFGWLLERRHGALVVMLLFALGGMGGAAMEALADPSLPIALGGNGAALALMCAWAVPDVLRARRGEEHDGDLVGVAIFAALLFLMPLADDEVSWVAGGTGVLVGVLFGLVLARVHAD